MPRGDGTGPAGMGPMTGRAAGYCAGYSVPGYINPVGGRGGFGNRGPGFGGGGRGRRNWYYATGLPGWARAARGMPAWGGYGAGYVPDPGVAPGGYAPGVAPAGAPNPEQEKEALRQQAEYLQQSLDEINERIEQLDKSSSEQD